MSQKEAHQRDTLYQAPLDRVEKFRFNEGVATVFDDMISRSVPGYSEAQATVATLATLFASPGSVVYDLGCSTGTTLISIAEKVRDDSICFVGIDNSEPMLTRCREKISHFTFRSRIDLRCCDLFDVEFSNATVIILNYTLQFIPPERRLELLAAIYRGLRPGGVVLVTEKIRYHGPTIQEAMTRLHFDFKRGNHYSDLEIAQKRSAIEDVLIPFTPEQNLELLQKSGFVEQGIVCQWLNFSMFLGVKEGRE